MPYPLASAAVAYMFESTPLWDRLSPARRLLGKTIGSDELYQVRESARITFHRHIVPLSLSPSPGDVEDALPLFIMYVDNAAQAVEPYRPKLRDLPVAVYGTLEGFMEEHGEKEESPMLRGLRVLQGLELGADEPDSIRLGAFYSLLLAVTTVAYTLASRVPRIRLALAPLYGLARESLGRLG